MPRKENTQMKKKIFLLASVAMGIALVGGTFAAWAVTDNADPFSIKVSTGSITADDTAEYVTLEWGAQQSMSSVSNLKIDTVRKAGVLDLRANTSSNNTPNGYLSYSVEGGALLTSKLEVKIYADDLPASEGIISAATLNGKTALTFSEGKSLINVTKNTANLYTVAVNLKAGTTASEIEALGNEQVTIEFDWGAGTGLLTSRTLYATGFTGAPKMYAWKGDKVNAIWPGVDMVAVSGRPGVYSAVLNVELENVIFSYDDDYTNETNRQQSGDLVVATFFSGDNNLFTYTGSGDAKGTATKLPEEKTPTYFLVGDEFGNWNASETGAIALTNPSNGVYTTQITTTVADSAFKIVDTANNIWYAESSTDGGAGNVVLHDPNTYTITFNPAGPTYIVCA